MSLTTVTTIAVVYVLVGVVLAVGFWRTRPPDLTGRQLRNAPALLVVVATCWPGVLLVAVLCQFRTGRVIVGRLFAVDPADIEPRGDRG